MFSFIVDEIANNPIDTLTHHFLIVENSIDSLRDPTQPYRTFSMVSFKVGNCGCSIRSTLLKLLVDDVFFRMMAGIGISFEELDYCAKYLIIWRFTSIKYA